MKVHLIKILYKYYIEILQGKKTFEIRLNDRNYQVGDLLDFIVIRDITQTKDLTTNYYQITHILRSEDFPDGLKDGYCILSIKKVGD